MSRVKKATVTGFLTVGLVVSGAGLASAALHDDTVGGGTWRWGTTSSTAQSHYHHPNNCHTATVGGKTVVKKEAEAGDWARANAARRDSGNEAFWNNEC